MNAQSCCRDLLRRLPVRSYRSHLRFQGELQWETRFHDLQWTGCASQIRKCQTFCTHSQSVGSATQEMSDTPTSKQIWESIATTYDRALKAGAVSKTDTDVRLFTEEKFGVNFILRIATALRDKPKPPADSNKSATWRNPFLPYEEALFVTHLTATHLLLLNKFNLVPHHVLVVTRQFEPQEEMTLADFEAVLPVIMGMPTGALAFYNRGDQSGASQPHKHVQVVPLPLAEGCPVEPPFSHVVQQACHSHAPFSAVPLKALPFKSYACSLTSKCVAGELWMAYQQLLDMCRPGSAGDLSYNFVMTREFMMMAPRSTAGVGPVAVNSMGLAGSFFVRSKEEMDYVERESPMEIMTRVGFPW